MKIALLALVVGMGLGGNARADVAGEMTAMIEGLPGIDPDKVNPVFSYTNDDAYWSGKKQSGNQPNFGAMNVSVKNLVATTSADKKVAWLSAEVKGTPDPDECAPEPCKPNRDPPLHVSGVVERSGKDWTWVAWHVAAPVTAKAEAAIKKAKTRPDVIPRDLRKADELVEIVEAAIAAPADFGAMISDRKDVVLYGSASKERYIGAAKIRKQLAAWKMSFRATDGVQAGMVGAGTAWVAMNVDAVSIQKPVTLGTYRLSLVLEKTASAWKIVQLHFSVDRDTPTP